VSGLNRRQLLAAGGGAIGAAAAGVLVGGYVWPLLGREDLIPGEPPTIELPSRAWTTTTDRLRFAAVGDNGSGGRQAMAVASRMAETYADTPFGLVAHLGDISYYGNFEKRFAEVFARPMAPLIDAGVGFELAIGNHDQALRHSDEGLEQIEAELRLLGTPSLYYSTTHGPADFFFLDSSVPGVFGPGSSTQWEWLDDSLASSTSQWKIVAMHHPLYSSGRHGSTVGARERLEPILARRHVDLVLAGHDHNYERTHPQQGITYVVSGGGCKTTSVGHSAFTATAASILQFLMIDIDGDRLEGRCIRVDGHVADRFVLRARENR
jgi:calcineurin-like phosphoesterase family protein